MERLGLGWEDARVLNERLVYCALKGYLPGPYEHLPALDEVVQMQAGLAYMTGPPGRPLRAGASVVDLFGGVFGIVAILAALRERERTGRGQLVRSSLFETTAFLVTQHMAASALTGSPVPPMPGRRGAAWCVYDVFATADDPVFIGVTSEAHWIRFCAAFPIDDLRDDPALVSDDDRVRERPRVVARLSELFREMSSADVLARCRAALIPCAPVARPDQLFDDPHLNAERGTDLNLADTMGWASPRQVKRLVGAVRELWPELRIKLHLRDTRGQAVANALAGMEMGVEHFDASVGGLGGCPFAGHKGAAGNIATEDRVFSCEEMGIETGIDLDAMVEVARLAESWVGHELPGKVMKGGTLTRFKKMH